MIAPITFTPAKRNFKRFYSALLDCDDSAIPSMGDYLPLDDLKEPAIKLRKAREEGGKKGLKVEMAKLVSPRTPLGERIKEIISGEEEVGQEQEEPVGTLLSDVKVESIQWLWEKRLALRKLTIFDGDPGLGKTTLMLHLAALLSRGRPFPNDTRTPLQGGTVLITLEDGLGDTIRPRLERMGAALDKIVSIGFLSETVIDEKTGEGRTYERPFSLATDISQLEAAIDRVKAKLVIIDPIMAVIGNKDTYKDNEVRAALAPLKAVAERKNVAIVMIRHFTKTGGDHAIYRGGGSIAFIGLARTALMATKDPGDPTLFVLANIKNNLSKEAPSLNYRVVDDSNQGDSRSYIKWEGESIHTVQELLATPEKQGVNRQRILTLLQEKAPQAMTPSQVWQNLQEETPDLELTNVTTTMYRMSRQGQLKVVSRGCYTIPSL